MNRTLLTLSIVSFVILGIMFYLHRENFVPRPASDMERAIIFAEQYSGRMVVQNTPLQSQYPFLATLFFLSAYHNRPFSLPMEEGWALGLLLLTLFTIGLAYGLRAREYALLVLPSILITTLLIDDSLLFARYDAIVFLSLFLLYVAHTKHLHVLAGMLLIFAIFLKISPVFLVPLLWFHTPTKKRIDVLTGMTLGLLGILLLAMLTIGLEGLGEATAYTLLWRFAHGIQVECVLSGVDMLIRMILGAPIGLQLIPLDNGVWNPDLPQSASSILFVLMVLGECGLAYLAAQKEVQEPRKFLSLYTAGILWILITSPLLSPQYQFWVLPFIVIHLLQAFVARRKLERSEEWMAVLLIVISVGSQSIWPHNWFEFAILHVPGLILLNNIRNIALIVLFGLLVSRASGTTLRKIVCRKY